MAKKVLFIFNSDYGQANPLLSTTYAFVTRYPDVEVHVASFHSLERKVKELSEQASRPVIWHGIDGMAQFERSLEPDIDIMKTWDRKQGLINAARTIMALSDCVLPWTPEEYVEIYRDFERIVRDVIPDLVVMDPNLSPALTMCHHIGVRWIVQLPSSIKDGAAALQPHLAVVWKYPFTYPMSFLAILRNIVLALAAGYSLLTDKSEKRLTEYLHKTIDPSLRVITAPHLGLLTPPPPGVRAIMGTTPDLDFPFKVIPDHMIPAGPVVYPAVDVDSADPSLAAWLRRGPTILVTLGTHLQYTTEEAVEMAKAFRDLLDMARTKGLVGGEERGQKLQILWKLMPKIPRNDKQKVDYSHYIDCVHDILGPEMDDDRVRVTKWLSLDPFSILMCESVICSVHHGGASSFAEAICAGVPHVAVPAWGDCFDYGNRVEMFGIGSWANKKSVPRWERNELSRGIVEVLIGPEAAQFRERARDLARKYPDNFGRDKAAEAVFAELERE